MSIFDVMSVLCAGAVVEYSREIFPGEYSLGNIPGGIFPGIFLEIESEVVME